MQRLPGAIEKAFREIVQERMDALFWSADGFLLTHSEQIWTITSAERWARRTLHELDHLIAHSAACTQHSTFRLAAISRSFVYDRFWEGYTLELGPDYLDWVRTAKLK